MARRERHSDDDVRRRWYASIGWGGKLIPIIQGTQTKDTLSDRKVMNVVKMYVRPHSRIIDPFARNCQLAGKCTNDIDPNTKAHYHVDALDFLQMDWGRRGFDVGILDPPFSPRQDKEIYGDTNLYTKPAKLKKIELALGNLIRTNGYVIKFGYNSNFSHKAFELEHIVLVQYGGCINDMIISIHTKTIPDLKEWNK